MKIKHIIKAIFVLAYLFSTTAHSDTFSLEVTANIDGRSDLIISGNNVTWQQFDYGTVGLYNPDFSSTILSMTSTVNNNQSLNYYVWNPTWPDMTTGLNSYGNDGGVLSSTFSGLYPGAPQQPFIVTLTTEVGRGTISLIQLPTLSNHYTTIVDFNDNPIGGSANYKALINFSPAPEVEEWAMMLLGLPLVGWVTRRKQSAMQIATA
ncbi:hypothetical protein [Methylomonas sp. AM2-LC]|uniref:hypothetical protein n=1 Tax=Methylomonas sp. AM2-LC TaxID=3153301 RepID=UPI0032673C6E